MTKPTTSTKKQRTRYTNTFRAEVLSLTERVEVAAVARDLGLQLNQIY